MQPTNPADATVPWIPHDEFRAGLPRGRFRVVVNPALARPFVMARLRINALALVPIGAGAALALSGRAWAGLALGAFGITFNRLTRAQAPRILLYLAERNAAVYREATQGGVMEVTRA
jgi:hypothetical protein